MGRLIWNKKGFAALALLLLSLAFLLCGCSQGEPVTESRIVSVEICGEGEQEDREIKISVELTDPVIDSCGKGKAYIYVLDSHMDAGTDLEKLVPIAEFVPKRRVTVELPMTYHGGSLLYASFVVGAHDAELDRRLPLTSPMAVGNPWVLAESDGEDAPVFSSSIKGLASQSLSDALALGVAHTLVQVPMEELILDKHTADGEAYTHNGKTYYVNKNVLRGLDEEIDAYASAGIRVYLQFTLGKGAAVSDLYLSGAKENAEGYAVNMKERASAERMEGFFALMASRYAAYGEGISFIIGNRVNDMANGWNGGDMTAAEQVSNTEKLLRVANTAMRAYNPLGHVYVSLDSHWGEKKSDQGFGIKDYLGKLAAEASYKGTYDWQVACDLYAGSSKLWETEATASDKLTVLTLAQLTTLLASESQLTARGEARSVILTDFRVSSQGQPSSQSQTGEGDQAMSYVHGYVFAYAQEQVKALFYARHTDAEGSDDGLRTLDDGGRAGAAREIYGLFRDIDTVPLTQVLSAMESYTGNAYTRQLEAAAIKPLPVVKAKGEGELLPYDEKGREKTEVLFSFDRGNAHGISKLEGVSRGEFLYEESISRSCLHTVFAPTSAYPVGVSFDLDGASLMKKQALLLDFYHAVNSDENAPVEIILLLSGTSDQGTPLTYQGQVSSADVKRWATASFDVSAFTKELKKDSSVTMSLLYIYDEARETEPSDDLSLTVVLDAVRLTEQKGMDMGMMIMIVAAAVLVVGTVAVIVVVKRKRS